MEMMMCCCCCCFNVCWDCWGDKETEKLTARGKKEKRKSLLIVTLCLFPLAGCALPPSYSGPTATSSSGGQPQVTWDLLTEGQPQVRRTLLTQKAEASQSLLTASNRLKQEITASPFASRREPFSIAVHVLGLSSVDKTKVALYLRPRFRSVPSSYQIWFHSPAFRGFSYGGLPQSTTSRLCFSET